MFPIMIQVEVQSVMSQVANIVNDRPLFVDELREGELIIPITVNVLLLDKTRQGGLGNTQVWETLGPARPMPTISWTAGGAIGSSRASPHFFPILS